MSSFVPHLVFMQKAALNYPLGQELIERFHNEGIEVLFYTKNIPTFHHKSFKEGFLFFKRIMVISVWRRKEFQTCKPSAHYQLPLVSGCPGLCEYCYLNTNLGLRPLVKVYVNLEDIFRRAAEYVKERRPETTVFEGAATSDPVAVEDWTGGLKQAIEFFAALTDARFRFVTKYTDVDGLLGIDHKGKTEIRFSLNCDYVVEKFERRVPPTKHRLKAAVKTLQAGYPLGFLIAPIFIFEGWRQEYKRLLQTVKDYVPRDTNLTFELVTHRFTSRSKKIIREAYPETQLPLEEEERQFKHGQFGYGKYVYPEDQMEAIRDFFTTEIGEAFPRAKLLYFV